MDLRRGDVIPKRVAIAPAVFLVNASTRKVLAFQFRPNDLFEVVTDLREKRSRQRA
jgi:hypothetical protein